MSPRGRIEGKVALITGAASGLGLDPLGLALENYNTSGTFRTQDAHKPIDASGFLDKAVYKDAAGLGKVVMTCKNDVKRVTIDPSLLADDKDMLEDLVAAAFNDAVRRAEEVSSEKMGKLTAGMPMPPGMKFPF